MPIDLGNDDFKRLLSEQHRAIDQTNEQISTISKFIKEYKAVKSRLADSLLHFRRPAIIGFSKKALVPGELVHTNEVLVYLGGHGNYFAEMSAHEAQSLLDSRIERLQNDIAKLKQQRKLLEDRCNFTEKIVDESVESASGEQEVKIHEEFDEEAEIIWQKKHRESIIRERTNKAVTLKTPHHVTFAEEAIDETSSTSSSGSENLPLSTITFSHTCASSRAVKLDMSDWHVASPADVVCHIEAATKIEKVDSNPIPSFPLDPFGNIFERKEAPKQFVPLPADPASQRPISRFKSRRANN